MKIQTTKPVSRTGMYSATLGPTVIRTHCCVLVFFFSTVAFEAREKSDENFGTGM